MSKLFTLVLTKSGKEVAYMTDTLVKVKARKKTLENSQRGIRTNYSIRPALEDEEKYRRPPNFNFDPSGDAGSKKYLQRKARAKRIKQKNPRKDHKPVEPTVVATPPEHYRYSGVSRQGAEDMRNFIENDEVAACVVVCDGVYYTIYAEF
jgi:hypothetical protein